MKTNRDHYTLASSTAGTVLGLLAVAASAACVEPSGRDDLFMSEAEDGRDGGQGGLEVGGTCFPVCGAGAVDPDGDGWGWENDASCIVDGSSPAMGATPCGDQDPAPTSDGIEVGGTCFAVCGAGAIDPDGDGWGWENDASCIVDGSAPAQSGEPCQIDGPGGGDPPVGDGPSPGCGHDGFYIDGGKLFDVHCNEFIPRGINYPYAWYSWRSDTEQQFADMAGAGANAVRVVL
ncbi:MAG: carbohydrate-binding domain-containing protein, partial [Myxococcota bacterium]